MRRIAIVIALSAALAGCAIPTEAGFRQRLDTWVGKSADDLVVKRGPPTRTFDLSDGQAVWQYTQDRTVTTGGMPMLTPQTTTVIGSAGQTYTATSMQTQYTPIDTVQLHCNINFLIDRDHTIKSYTLAGNDCRALPPK